MVDSVVVNEDGWLLSVSCLRNEVVVRWYFWTWLAIPVDWISDLYNRSLTTSCSNCIGSDSITPSVYMAVCGSLLGNVSVELIIRLDWHSPP